MSAAESELDAVRFDVIRQRVAAGKRLGINFSDPEPGMNTAVVHYVLDVEFLLDQCDDGTKCLYADTFDGRCALAATADSPPPERVQMAELVRDNERLRQECDKWRGIADEMALVLLSIQMETEGGTYGKPDYDTTLDQLWEIAEVVLTQYRAAR